MSLMFLNELECTYKHPTKQERHYRREALSLLLPPPVAGGLAALTLVPKVDLGLRNFFTMGLDKQQGKDSQGKP